MNDSWATVVSVDGDRAIIHGEQGGCGRCREAGGCGGAHLGQLFCRSPRIASASNPEHCKVGDRVRVCVDQGVIGRSAWHAYLVPLLAMLAGAFAGSLLAGEAGAMVGTLLGLFSGWLGLRRAARRVQQEQRWQLTIRP